jgi:hypothetical protein
LGAVIAIAATQAMAQQDEGPILRPHKPVAKPAAATLLVLCDLTCNWKLDGKAQGVIAAGDSAKVKVELGQHVISATTEDGLDRIRQVSEVKATGQTAVTLDLAPVHDARLKAEQEAREKAALAQRENELRNAEQEARDRAARESKERDQAATAGSADVWTDPSSRLMWAPRNSAVSVEWKRAQIYCPYLRSGGYSDWRMPTIDELAALFDRNEDAGGQHIKGGIHLGGAVWGYRAENASGVASYFNFHDGMQYSIRFENLHASLFTEYALCVRRSGD